jgi:hypothetical protein
VIALVADVPCDEAGPLVAVAVVPFPALGLAVVEVVVDAVFPPEFAVAVPCVATVADWLFVSSGPLAPAGVERGGDAAEVLGGGVLSVSLTGAGVGGVGAGVDAVAVVSSAWARPPKKKSAMNKNAPNSRPRNTTRGEQSVMRDLSRSEAVRGSAMRFPERTMPQWLDVDVTEPLLVWVTLVVLLFVADAAPVVTVADEVPVFEPLFVFVAVPLDDVAVCELSFDPSTCDFAELSPEFATAVWCVETDAHWSTFNDVPWPPSRESPRIELLAADASAVELFVLVTFPLFDWLAIVAAVLLPDAAPLVTDACESPEFVPSFELLAVPSLEVAVWSLPFQPKTPDLLRFRPLFDSANCRVCT